MNVYVVNKTAPDKSVHPLPCDSCRVVEQNRVESQAI